jgi:hypothetical protein
LAIPQETLQPLRKHVAKALKHKDLSKRKMETFTSKIIDLTQPNRRQFEMFKNMKKWIK